MYPPILGCLPWEISWWLTFYYTYSISLWLARKFHIILYHLKAKGEEKIPKSTQIYISKCPSAISNNNWVWPASSYPVAQADSKTVFNQVNHSILVRQEVGICYYVAPYQYKMLLNFITPPNTLSSPTSSFASLNSFPI